MLKNPRFIPAFAYFINESEENSACKTCYSDLQPLHYIAHCLSIQIFRFCFYTGLPSHA